MQKPSKSLTIDYNQIVRAIVCNIKVSEAFDPRKRQSLPPMPAPIDVYAIWDTGATNTVITDLVIFKLSLKPIRPVTVQTPKGKFSTETYLVNLMLPNGVGFAGWEVTRGDLSEGINMLIGMDVISKGDFAISNLSGRTCCTYRYPSIERVDFVDDFKREQERLKELKHKKKGKKKKR